GFFATTRNALSGHEWIRCKCNLPSPSKRSKPRDARPSSILASSVPVPLPEFFTQQPQENAFVRSKFTGSPALTKLCSLPSSSSFSLFGSKLPNDCKLKLELQPSSDSSSANLKRSPVGSLVAAGLARISCSHLDWRAGSSLSTDLRFASAMLTVA